MFNIYSKRRYKDKGYLWGGLKMKLLDIAHSRTGDKGNISNISLIVYNEKD